MEKTIESSRERQKVLDGEQNMASIDRLSALPNDVLCHILSYLPTKFSVSTSILSRRWRFIWAHVPTLDFITIHDRFGVPRFSNIVTRVMFQHKVQSLDTFRLFYTFAWNEHEIETWITTAICRNVKNIVIKLYYQPVLHVCLFTCKTLIDLSLDEICLSVVLNGAVCLPCLKKLHLNSVKLDGDESLPRLLSGCPVLMELIIDGIIDCKSICCNISSPTIKRLELDFCQFNGFGVRRDCRLEINTPALRYLQLKVHSFNAISAQMLPSLIEADIRSNVVLNFLDDLNNVKCLKYVQPFPNRVFAYQSKSITRFDNLTKLELAVDWPVLVKFLESADNLEVLIIREVDKMSSRIEPFQQVPECLLSHLRTVTISEFGFAEHEFKMVRYVLRNAKVLKRMEIYSRHHCSIGFKNISLFERGSEACELAFY